MEFNELYDILHDIVGVGNEALDLVFGINGCNEETACNILFFYTGWHNFGGYFDEISEE